MTINELSRYYHLSLKVQSLRDRIKELNSTTIGASKISEVKVDSSHNNDDPTSRIAIKLYILKKKLEEVLEESIEEETKINEYIESIDDLEVQEIVRYRFISLMKWEDIADKLRCDRTLPLKKLKIYLAKEGKRKR